MDRDWMPGPGLTPPAHRECRQAGFCLDPPGE